MNIDVSNFASDSESDTEQPDENIASLCFHNPFTCIIAGPLQSGKTWLTSRILENANWLYSHKPNQFFYFYNKRKPDKPFLKKNCVMLEGVPDMAWLEKMHSKYGDNVTVVIDDQAMHMGDSQTELFTVGCSRFKANIIFITQNLFNPRKGSTTLTKNSIYSFLMKNPKEKGTYQNFFRTQPENTADLMAYAKEACASPFSYMFIDSHQKTDPDMRHMYNLFGENPKLRFPKVARFT